MFTIIKAKQELYKGKCPEKRLYMDIKETCALPKNVGVS